MQIITTFEGDQKKFHWYWLPLMYKHSDCVFNISGKFTYPNDVKNLKVNSTEEGVGPTQRCPINMVPSYKAMAALEAKPQSWVGTHEDLGERFYEV